MTGSKRDLTVLIGRFSLLHKGHTELIERALRLSHQVVIVVGSAAQPRTTKNPFTAQERKNVIDTWYRNLVQEIPQIGDLKIVTTRDYRYNNTKWLSGVQAEVKRVAPAAKEIYLTGSDRDSSTFYLKMFPGWKLDLVEENRTVSKVLSATALRNLFFANEFDGKSITDDNREMLLRAFIPTETRVFLEYFKCCPDYSVLMEEFELERKTRARLEELKKIYPYPILVQCADAVVFQTGHVLLVKRRAAPGKGLWALPGGHLDPKEWLLDCAVRELYEETSLDVPELALRGSYKFDHRFEHPERSIRGRVLTQAFCFELTDYVVDGKIKLPKVKGGDDAETAKWFPISEVKEMSAELFDDHWDIISDFSDRLERANVGGRK